MSTFIYQPASRVIPGRPDDSNHWFGGSSSRRGVRPKGCLVDLHLVFDFDTHDPLFPVKLPNARRLPVYYGFPYNGGAVGYSVVSDEEIVVHYMQTKKAEEGFPFEEFPSVFPRIPVRLEELEYEDQKILAFNYFVSQPQSGLVLAPDDKRRLKDLNYPFTQLGGVHVMWQDIPVAECPNTKCPTRSTRPRMDVFAVIWNKPVPGVFLWDNSQEYSDGCDVQLICQICRECHAIHVCNRCT